MNGTSLLSPGQVAEIIRATLPPPIQLPSGHRNAFVSTVDASGWYVGAVFVLDKWGASWQLQGACHYGGTDNRNQWGATLIASW